MVFIFIDRQTVLKRFFQIKRKPIKRSHTPSNEIYKINDPKKKEKKKSRKTPKFYYSTPKHTSECPLNDINLYTL